VVLAETANLAFDESRYAEAKELGGRTLEAYRRIGHLNGEAWTQGKLGNVHWAIGEYAEAGNLYSQCLESFRRLGDLEGIAWALNSLGHALRGLGDYPRALERYREGLSLYRRASHRWGTAWSNANIGGMECLLGRPDVAEIALREAHATFKAIGNPWGTAFAFLRKDWERAQGYFQEALPIFEAGGNRREAAVVLLHLGETALAMGDPRECGIRLAKAIESAVEISAAPLALRVMAAFCALEKVRGSEGAATAYGQYVLRHPAADHETRQMLGAPPEGPDAESFAGRFEGYDWKRVAGTLY
jgi:tetratricopeptide (TPR) repeat protein